MAFLAGIYHRRSYLSAPLRSIETLKAPLLLIPNHPIHRSKWLCTSSTQSPPSDFKELNAYDLLQVPETSSFSQIKASFLRLAKETHPDLAQTKNDAAASRRFVQILAAYEILSDSVKRAHYDRCLISQRRSLQKASRKSSPYYWRQMSHVTMTDQMEVVEWLKWYRYSIKEILSEKYVVTESGYFNVLEGDFYSAIHAAYYGPDIESLDLLPDRFEAEERSASVTPEVLHLVSGRDLFGMVCIADKIEKLPNKSNKKLISFASTGSVMCRSVANVTGNINLDGLDVEEKSKMQVDNIVDHSSEAFKDLELYISGKVVAMATRIPPGSCFHGIRNEDSEDHIHVFLSPDADPIFGREVSKDSPHGRFVGGSLLGTIAGMGTSPEEGSCTVYNSNGVNTHVIMKHRTLLVKHMHWYQVGNEVSRCECRCSRARLPPSKYWLFEPRCGLHDIGGWYIELFGKDKKGRTTPSGRYWDGFDLDDEHEKRLHPAIYLLTLAYRSLDLEVATRKKQNRKGITRGILTWCRNLI